jgi:hypothetical protein
MTLLQGVSRKISLYSQFVPLFLVIRLTDATGREQQKIED